MSSGLEHRSAPRAEAVGNGRGHESVASESPARLIFSYAPTLDLMRIAVLVSILAHAGALLVARPIAASLAALAPAEGPLQDVWAGSSIEVTLGGDGTDSALGDAPPASPAAASTPTEGPAGAGTGDTFPSPPPTAAPSNAPSARPSATMTSAPRSPKSDRPLREPSPNSAPSAKSRTPPDPPSSAQPVTSAAPADSATAKPTLRLPDLPSVVARSKAKKAAAAQAELSPSPSASASASASASSPAPSTSALASAKPTASTAPLASAKPTASTAPLAFAKPPSSTSPVGSSAPAGSGAVAAGSAQPVASGGAGGKGGTFGSEAAAAVRDLGRAFTRAIPAACSADPVWGKLAPGDTLKLTVELKVDGDGHITSAEPVGKDPPKALVSLLRRTIPMLQGGTFAVRGGTVSAGTETLELSATVSDDAAPTEGAKDSLAFSYSGDRGKASFTQTGGRHVDIAVHVAKVVTSD